MTTTKEASLIWNYIVQQKKKGTELSSYLLGLLFSFKLTNGIGFALLRLVLENHL